MAFSLDKSLGVLFPEIAKEWHPHKNGFFTPVDVAAKSNKRFWWYSESCGHEWQTSCGNRTNGNKNCPYCANQKLCVENCLENKFPEIACEWDYEKNHPLKPRDVIAGTGRYFWWICNKCKWGWKTKCCHRTFDNSGCPNCSTISKGENLIKNYLEIKNVKFYFQYKLKIRSWADFYLPEINTIIEYQGKQHYIPHNFGSKEKDSEFKMFKDVVEGDLKKQIYCKNNFIKIIFIPFWDLKNIKKILDCIISNKKCEFSAPPKRVKIYQCKVDLIIEEFNEKLEGCFE